MRYAYDVRQVRLLPPALAVAGIRESLPWEADNVTRLMAPPVDARPLLANNSWIGNNTECGQPAPESGICLQGFLTPGFDVPWLSSFPLLRPLL